MSDLSTFNEGETDSSGPMGLAAESEATVKTILTSSQSVPFLV